MRLPFLTALGLLSLAAVLAAAMPAAGADEGVRASAVAVQIAVPGAQTTAAGSSGSGSYAYRDLVSVGGYSVGTERTALRARATARLTGVSLLGGLVTASAISGGVLAEAEGGDAAGDIGGVVEGLTVNGAAVAPGQSARFDIPDIGYVITDERVVLSDPGSPTYRAFQVALHLHLTAGWHDMPAGTDVLLGYADAGATLPPDPRGGEAAPVGTPPPANPKPKPITPPAAVPTPPAYTPPPGYDPGDAPGYSDDGFPNTQAPPPGGFTASPPIDQAVRDALLGPAYVFPVAGGASFINDWGAPRASTGFHQGIDLFAPLGTPLLAVTDGELLKVGWNSLGGHRLWLKDDAGNYFYYAHLSAYAPVARNGARVKAGEVIGFTGNSGEARTTPFHMHFEIHPAGSWAVPPFEYVSRWMGNTAPFASGTIARVPPTLIRRPAAVALGGSDISSASALDTGAVQAAAQGEPAFAPASFGIIRGAPVSPRDLLRPTRAGHPFEID